MPRDLPKLLNSPLRTTLAILAGLTALWTLAPSLTTGTLPRDTLEALYWGLGWSWTSPKHPPMAPFIAEIAFRASGGRMWSVYLVGAGMTTSALALLIWLGHETLGHRRSAIASGSAMALLSAAFLLLLPLSHEFNPNIALLPFWVLVTVLAWRAARDNRPLDWIALGLAAGFGLLAKYTIVLALAAAALGLLATRTGRQRAVRPWGAVLAFAVMALVATPHLLAVAKGDFVTFHVAARDTIWEPERRFSLVTLLDVGEFLGILALATGIPALIAWLFLRNRTVEPIVSEQAQDGRIYVIVACLAALGLTVVSGLLGARMRAPWALPLGLMIGPLLLAIWPRLGEILIASGSWAARSVLAAALVLPPIFFGLYFTFAAQIAPRNPLREHVDGKALAALATTYWQRFGTGVPPLVLGLTNGALERQAMGSISLFMPGRPPAYQYFWVIRYGGRLDPALERFVLERDWTWINMSDVRARGGIAVAVGPEPPLWRRLGQCLDNLESMPLPVIRKGYRPQQLWLARIVPGAADAGPCPAPPEDYRAAAGLGPAPKTMDRLN